MKYYTTDFVHIKNEVLEEINNTGKVKSSLTYIYNPTVFMQQSLVCFANMPLVRNEAGKISMSKSIEAVKQAGKIITPNGFITEANFRAVLAILYHAPRSYFVRSMNKNPELGSFTPLVMWGNKKYKDIPYTEWDLDDKLIDFATGSILELAMKDLPPKPDLSRQDIVDLRAESLTYKTGTKSGEMEKLTAYKMFNKRNINGHIYNRWQLFQLLQTWICNAEVRNTESMVLDLWDWGNVPEPIDHIIEKPKTQAADREYDQFREIRDL